MSTRKDNDAIGYRYEMIMEGNYTEEILEEGIKDKIFAGLLGLLAMAPMAKGSDTSTSGVPNKNQVQQVVQQATTSADLTMACVDLLGKTIEAEMRTSAELKSKGGDTTDLDRNIQKLTHKMDAIERAAQNPNTALQAIDQILQNPN